MSYIDELYKKVEMFIDNNLDEYALSIDGNWGSGKTYAIKKVIDNYNNNNEKRIEYVSLNGVDKLTFENLGIGKLSIADIANIIGSIVNVISPLKFEKAMEKIIAKTDKSDEPKDNIIALVFDDIERCKCDIDLILGFIDQVKNNNIKVIIVLNSEKIGNTIEEKKIYQEIKEKVIGTTIKWIVSDEIINNFINNIEIKNFDEENLRLLKICLTELYPNFFIDNYGEKNINLRLLKKTIIHTCYVIQYLNWNKNDGKYYEYSYKEIIKNVYVHFHKETYPINTSEKIEDQLKSSININKLNLLFINNYFNNGLYFKKERYEKELLFLLEGDKDEFNLKYNKVYSYSELNDFYVKIKDNLSKNIYPIFTYSNIIRSIFIIDYYKKSNHLKEITDIMCESIEKNIKIIYYFDIHYHIPEKQERYISNIKKALQKNNKKISLYLLEEYINNLPNNNFSDIDEIISKYNYCEEKYEILEDIDIYRFLSQKEIWNKYYYNKNYDSNVIDFIRFLFHYKDRKNEDYIKQIKKIISILNAFKKTEQDCAKKIYIDRHINELKSMYAIK